MLLASEGGVGLRLTTKSRTGVNGGEGGASFGSEGAIGAQPSMSMLASSSVSIGMSSATRSASPYITLMRKAVPIYRLCTSTWG
jgi:hypothetical protein